jgi:hypothetical protein
VCTTITITATPHTKEPLNTEPKKANKLQKKHVSSILNMKPGKKRRKITRILFLKSGRSQNKQFVIYQHCKSNLHYLYDENKNENFYSFFFHTHKRYQQPRHNKKGTKKKRKRGAERIAKRNSNLVNLCMLREKKKKVLSFI